jgi:glyoxalase family protein
MSIHSIHHVTAVTADIRTNLRFYTQTLGLRLVKKSVNQDDVSAYHLFYADKTGTPGTDMTFFDWPLIGPNVTGSAQVGLTSFLVPKGSLDWWETRLEMAGAFPERGLDELGNDAMIIGDPEGQRIELVDAKGVDGWATPWEKEVPEDYALRGILGVDLHSARPTETHRLLTDILGYKDVGEGVYETQGDGHYARLKMQPHPMTRVGRVGAGGVHHVAFRIDDVDELHRMQEKIEAIGGRTSGLVDRFYFQSLYFREPGGVLFELATDGPGFASDEDPVHLGETLALPPFLEPRRAEIEAGLKPLS